MSKTIKMIFPRGEKGDERAKTTNSLCPLLGSSLQGGKKGLQLSEDQNDEKEGPFINARKEKSNSQKQLGAAKKRANGPTTP